MTESGSSQQVWRFAIMFQIGMIVVGAALIAIAVLAGRSFLPAVLGVVFIGLAVAGIWYSRRQLRELRK